MLNMMEYSKIDESTVDLLIKSSAIENVNLEFKRKFENSESGNKKFVKCVSAFANTQGGYLIIGLGESNGIAKAKFPIPSEQVDNEIQRLESLMSFHIEPRVVGVRIREIKCESGGSLILIHVPKSYNPPHRVRFKQNYEFFVRKSSQIIQPDVEELRLLFGQQTTLEEQAVSFIRQRFLDIRANDGVLPLNNIGNALVIHTVPLQDFGTKRRHNILSLRDVDKKLFIPHAAFWNESINLDGIIHYSNDGKICSYGQVYRDGTIESVSDKFITPENMLKSIDIIEIIGRTIYSHFRYLKEINASTPILLQISFLGTNDVNLSVETSETPNRYMRDELHLPSLIVQEYKENDDYFETVAEQLNFLWNAFGLEKCEEFLKRYTN